MSDPNTPHTVLITGAAKGIGKAIALNLAAKGYQIVVNYKSSKAAAESVCNEIENAGGIAFPAQADVSDRAEVEALASLINERFGQLYALINNAGILEQKPFEQITDNDWQLTIDANLKSAFICSQIFAQSILYGGSIINISSIGGEIGGPKAVHYAASKGAMLTLTKSTARVLSKDGIRVNAVTPGFIDTEMFRHILSVQNLTVDGVESTIPLGRIGHVEDVANAVAFLISSQASYITGETIRVNGGTLI